MKKLFVLTVIALLATAVSYAQKNVFVINGKSVENFDGSQLTGKKILSFKITTVPLKWTNRSLN